MKPLTFLLALMLGVVATKAADSQRLDEVLSGGFSFRNVGPFRAGSWIADIAVPETPARSHLYTFYVGARNGGVWKTTNNGTTFQPLFDDQDILSIGALAVAPTDEHIVWAGTGDASCTRSAYHGNGIYKSTDAGRTWQHLGLVEYASHRADRHRSHQRGHRLCRRHGPPVLEERRARRFQNHRRRENLEEDSLPQ